MKKSNKRFGIAALVLSIFSLYAIGMVVLSGIQETPYLRANNDQVVVAEDNFISIKVLENDESNDIEGLVIESFIQPSNGNVTLNQNDQTLRYTPKPNYFGTDQFTYTVRSTSGLTQSATVSIQVIAVNDIPTAENDVVSMNQGESILFDVLINDQDIERNGLEIHQIITQPQNGQIAIENHQIRYTPTPDFTGTVYFYYRAIDGDGGLSNQAKVTIHVQAIE